MKAKIFVLRLVKNEGEHVSEKDKQGYGENKSVQAHK